MIKATSGGGGRGISIVKSDEEFLKAFEKTSLEAEANFKDGSLYIEKYIESPRHIEIQIMADSSRQCRASFESDCSMQRRNQKMIEETPSAIFK
jgi:acetyl-CoA carboxylase, biotin carboxylase subunit